LFVLNSVTSATCAPIEDREEPIHSSSFWTEASPDAIDQACTGTSLLQASASSNASGWRVWQDSNLSVASAADWHIYVGAGVFVLFCGFVVAAWVFPIFRKSDESSEPPSPFHTLHLSHSIPRSETDDCDYDSVEEEESDAGDWQLDALVGSTIASQFGSRQNTADRSDYDPSGVAKLIEKRYSSRNLLLQILGVLMEFWVALAFMYWSLLYREEEMMDCEAYPKTQPHSVFVRHACYYTLACLRGFPILAANMVLVLMIRILIQTRLYYSMLRMSYVLDFANLPVMRTIWPWACGISMLQGGLHFALKAYFMPEKVVWDMYLRLVRKFVLPGTIFLSFLVRYVDIENTLMPLNRICEQDYSQNQKNCPWLEQIQVLSERILAFDARHRDIVGVAAAKLKRPPTLNDVIVNLVEHYDKSHNFWKKRKHRGWGLFRSMWPACVLVDHRLDWHDPETRGWLTVFAALSSGCLVVSALCLYLLFACTSDHAMMGAFEFLQKLFTGQFNALRSEAVVANVVMVLHGVLILVFINNTCREMFHLKSTGKKLEKSATLRHLPPA
jgi:hypothetical protein